MPRNSFNERFFKVIDSEIKAYLLGFIYADGTISFNNDKGDFRLQVAVTESDRDILELFKANLYPDSNIGTCPARNNTFNQKTYLSKPWCYFRIHSKVLVEDLMSHGVLPRKTYKTFGLPKLNENLMRHFIRGYFDGDGTVSLSVAIRQDKTKELVVNRSFSIISKNPDILYEIQDFLKKSDIKSSIRGDGKRNYVISSHALLDIQKLYYFLYENSNYFFKRKQEKFKQTLITSSAAKAQKLLSVCNA